MTDRIGHGITLEGLAVGFTRRRNARTVLRDLDAVAGAGELTVLLGPNGVGKSTLLRTIAGLHRPLAGSVTLEGVALDRPSRRALARRVAVVLTVRPDPGLLSVRDLVGLGRYPHTAFGGRLRAADHAAVAWALAAVEAEHLADRPVSALSDGERQRAFVARALAQEPSVVVLDEPTAFLDTPGRVALIGLLRRLAVERGLTVLTSTHDLELALRVADRVWLVDRSGRLHSATPEELTLDGRIHAAFSGPDLDFDPAAGGFAVRLPSVGTAFVDAPEPHRSVLGRALARSGWRPVAGPPADLTVAIGGTAGGQTVTTRLGEHRETHPDAIRAAAWAAGHAARRPPDQRASPHD